MKKITIIVTAFALLLTTTAFAAETEKVTKVITSGFKKDFSNASAVVWEKANGFYFAEFKLDGQNVSAAYTEDGELVATMRSLSVESLPTETLSKIAKWYKGYKITGVNELTCNGETSYSVTVENEKQSLKLKCEEGRDVTVEKRTEK